jgi:hypothetical protein
MYHSAAAYSGRLRGISLKIGLLGRTRLSNGFIRGRGLGSLITLFATLTREEAEAVLGGRVRLAQMHPVDSITVESEDTVCLSDQINPPMPEQLVVQIDLTVAEAALAEHVIPIVDHLEMNYDIPRSWLKEARCRLEAEEEITAFCIKTIDDPMLPSNTPYRVAIKEAVASGETEDISPYYLKAFHATPHLTVEAFPDRRCIHRYEGGAVYVAEQENRFYVILDESAMAGLLDDEDLKDMNLVRFLLFDSDAERDAYLHRRFGGSHDGSDASL